MSPSGPSRWPLKDIIYTAIVGTVMLAAFLEWFLWLAAFIYCLFKAYRKAEHWSVRVLAVLVTMTFAALRVIYLPIMIVTLPLPNQITQIFPLPMVSFLQWFGFWSFAALLTIPWLFCIYQIVTHSIGRTRRIKQMLDEDIAPKVVIIMPCYKEDADVLLTAINSVVDCNYPPSCIHLFLSFDGDLEDELYLKTIERLGVPRGRESYPKSIDIAYSNSRVTISRFVHGGKRNCQKATFKLIDRVYNEYLRYNDDLFILFIDSDCILDRLCIQNFVYDMELSPGNSRDMLAMTGVITSTTKAHSLITLLQDIEYIHGQLFERTVESGCGAVTCLPGALTMLRFSAFRRMAKYYFADKAEQCQDLFDYGKCHLGEDRWLTHLFMIGAKKRYQIQMCTSAFCKTEAVQTLSSLIKQRRRWFLGFITNEACMLTDVRIWIQYPTLTLVRFMQNTIRTTSLLFFVMVLSLITTVKRVKDLPVGFIAISLGLNWLMMIYFGIKLRRFKIWLYPIMFVLNPFFNWYYMIYGILTAGQRTWGGPRADAALADASTTSQQVIDKAMASGDDLNLVPETFKNAMEVKDEEFITPRTPVPLQPPQQLEGHFAASERPMDGYRRLGNDTSFKFRSRITDQYNQESIPFAKFSTSENDSLIQRNIDSHHLLHQEPNTVRDEYHNKYTIDHAGLNFASGAREPKILDRSFETFEMDEIDDINLIYENRQGTEPQLFTGGFYMTERFTPVISEEQLVQDTSYTARLLTHPPVSHCSTPRDLRGTFSSADDRYIASEPAENSSRGLQHSKGDLRGREEGSTVQGSSTPSRKQYRRYRQKHNFWV
ncbi:chitin synthase-domain-containing protein [Xylogone sp. PMI_703]|nr:chitin synthase-domain-containing protein [Xylogone sp. PMI_703]